MAILHESEAAFAELAATKQYEFGVRRGPQVKVGSRGIDVGEQLFDPARHDLTDINPLSLMESVTGQPHVKMVLPSLPMEISIVTQHDASVDDPRIAGPKQYLGQQLRSTLENALPRIGDRVALYHIGDFDDGYDRRDIEVIEADVNPIKNAQTVADICRNGLTIVISNFASKSLPLGEIGAQFADTIGIKANHPLELQVPLDQNIRLGGSREVSTRREAERLNGMLDVYHQKLDARLQDAGIALAHVVFDRNHPSGLQFDPFAADISIAQAVRSLDR